MKRTLYLECYSGISGDMTVAALLDLGACEDTLVNALKSLPLEGYQVKISRVKKAGLDVCDFHVLLDEKHENHDHDMEYLHGKHDHMHTHGEESKQEDKHERQNNHGHEQRGLLEIVEIINCSSITDSAKKLAIRIFTILAEAEAKAHGVEVNQVHFHEVGAVDSIVDIVAVAVCIDNLEIEEVIVPELYEGRGFVRCLHGTIPIPVPAVVNIASTHRIPLHITNTEGELITPTGAAIVAAIRTKELLPKKFTIEKIGIGAGKRTYDRPSMLRAILIKDQFAKGDVIFQLESNIDDCSGELLGYVMEQLFAAGAKDVTYTPIYMKKNRPAYQLNVICSKEDINKMEEIIFVETTTIGIRRVEMERTILERKIVKKHTSFGEVQVKICKFPWGEKCYPEYSSVMEVCKKYNVTYKEAYGMIQEEWKQ